MTTKTKNTTFLARDVHDSVTPKMLSVFLGLATEEDVVYHGDGHAVHGHPTLIYKVSVKSLDEAMAIFKKSNFTELKGNRICLEFWPPEILRLIPEIQFDCEHYIPRWKVYNFCLKYGTVVSVSSTLFGHGSPSEVFRYRVSYTTKDAARTANAALEKEKGSVVMEGQVVHVHSIKNYGQLGRDFWIPAKAPEKAKGNLISIPTNSQSTSRSAPLSKRIVGNRDATHSSGGSGSGSSISSSQQYSHNVNQKLSKRKAGSSEDQRTIPFAKTLSDPEFTAQPGDTKGTILKKRNFGPSHKEWCDTAFMCYETLYNMSSKSNQGQVSISTLAWSTQLDISTFRLHYGSIFTPAGGQRQVSVLSCLTVEMRQYGDKDSAAEVLAIRNNGYVRDASDALEEGMNVACKGPTIAMKCLESGHLVTSSRKHSGAPYTLSIWDLREQVSQAKTPVARLVNEKDPTELWFDAKRMDVCSVDSYGTIHTYDLYKSTSSERRPGIVSVDHTSRMDIDKEYTFHSSCISMSGIDSSILVGSTEYAQVARWDSRSPALAAVTSLACRLKNSPSLQRKFFDPIYGVEWNPSNSNEFMTVHEKTIRVWDTRKMEHDGFATFHNMQPSRIKKAQWSPHQSGCIAGLTSEGQVGIWSLKKIDGLVDLTTPMQHPEKLFTHQAHRLVVSDFAWCPYVEDVISTVSPGTDYMAGCLQVWRPRNLHDVDDFGEP